MNQKLKKKVCLLILDGWGYSNNWAGNAIKLSNPKNFNHLWDSYGHKILETYDKAKTLNMDNLKSEVCHTTISAGRFAKTLNEEISKSINERSFFSNKILDDAFLFSKKNDSAVHLIAPLNENAHSLDYIDSTLECAEGKNVHDIRVHLIIHKGDDGKSELHKLRDILSKFQRARIVSIMGSNFVTLTKKYDNIIRGYKTVVEGEGRGHLDFDQASTQIMAEKNDLSELSPMVMIEGGKPAGTLSDFDTVIFTYASPDLIKIFFSYFTADMNIRRLNKKLNTNLVAFSDYLQGTAANYSVICEPEIILPNIASVISESGLLQTHISDSSKTENVGYNFDGRNKEKYPGEKIMTVTSGSAIGEGNTQMSAESIAKVVIDQMMNNRANFILVNLANADFFAHTGDIKKTAEAVLHTDYAIGLIAGAALRSGTDLIITGDHGNAESMASVDANTIVKEHSNCPVPFILVSKQTEKVPQNTGRYQFKKSELTTKHGSITDIAPTILDLFGIGKPSQFIGNSLLNELD